MPATILLFDIDGTLIDGRGSGRRAMEGAMAAVAGSPGALTTLRFDGMTDRAIVRAGLRAFGRDADESAMADVLAEYLRRLPHELLATPPRMHAGVAEVLAAVGDRPDVAVGLGTGNLEEGARLKLCTVALWDRFAFGGYGSDHEDRAELLRRGLERGAARLGRPASACRAVVIGDTPRDVAAAQAIGARSLAVATSFYSVAELAAAGADVAVADLSAAEALKSLLDPE